MKKRFLVFSLLVLSLIMAVSAQEPTSTAMTGEIKEQVKCGFINSNTEQKCYTDDGKFGCSVTGEVCIADVSGEKGKKLLWKSSCEGEATTIIDGDNEYAEFKCPESEKQKIEKQKIAEGQLKEQVNCNFYNSNAEQKCYTDDGLYGCSGVGKCASEVLGEKNKKLIWKSSCGGYAYTVIDGVDGYAEFKCVPDSEVTLEQINNKGFRFAYSQCYDGSEQKQGDNSCQLFEYWQEIAIKFCENKCAGEKKCGLNSFSVSEECYLDSKPAYIDDNIQEVVAPSSVPLPVPTPEKEEKIVKEEKKQEFKEEKVEEKKEEILICKDSCPLDGKCYPFGYRNKGSYCSDTGSFVEQLKAESVCENNFECSSNLCIDSSCVSSSLIQKVISWLKNIFG